MNPDAFSSATAAQRDHFTLDFKCLAHEQRPDCVLLDYHLPDLNGLEFLAALADDTGDISIPVMMLTGTDNATIAVEAMKRGARDYLIKRGLSAESI